MSNEDMSQRIQGDTRKGKLAGNSIAAIDDIRNAVRNDDLSRSGTCLTRTRPSASA